MAIENTAVKDVSLYPNPVERILFFSAEMAGANVRVSSVTGSLLVEQTLTGNSLDVSHLKPGAYFMVVEKNDTRFFKRFVK